MIATDLTRADGMTVLKWSGEPQGNGKQVEKSAPVAFFEPR
jgi:hypothetical protein